MASVNKDETKMKLNSNLEKRLLEFAQETLQASGQNFEELNNDTKTQIINYTKLEAIKMSQGIVDGLEDIFSAINTNVNKINQLEVQISTSNTTTAT